MKYTFLIVLFFFSKFQANSQEEITLQEGTIVKIILMENLDSKVSKVGDIVNLEVEEDVIVDGKIIIKKGDKAVGKISKSNKAKWAGKKGELDFTIDYVNSFLGKNIRTGSNNDSDGKSRMGGVIAGAAVLGAPILLLIRGKNAIINKGTVFSVYVDKDYKF